MMSKIKLMPILCMVMLIWGAWGCGGQKQTESGRTPAAAAGETTAVGTAQPAPASPAELGQAIGAVYLEGLNKVTEMLKDKPEPGDIKPKVRELKESAIQKLVDLGRKREAMSEADRTAVEAASRLALNTVPADLFKAYQDAQSYYLSKDNELFNLIADFNIITQYAFFDLLKKQAPKEAERLGIK
jgi:hypothetical protein